MVSGPVNVTLLMFWTGPTVPNFRSLYGGWIRLDFGFPSRVESRSRVAWATFEPVTSSFSSHNVHVSWWPSVGSFHVLHLHSNLINYLFSLKFFLPLPGFEPGTSPVPSQFATNWAILAWMRVKSYYTKTRKYSNKSTHVLSLVSAYSFGNLAWDYYGTG